MVSMPLIFYVLKRSVAIKRFISLGNQAENVSDMDGKVVAEVIIDNPMLVQNDDDMIEMRASNFAKVQ
jgi:hypothetical protein